MAENRREESQECKRNNRMGEMRMHDGPFARMIELTGCEKMIFVECKSLFNGQFDGLASKYYN